ncbi:MAG: cation:proton antiporter [Actinobacteria bacterium]|nr:cation:proton antiporter [Actinomycetota bacterium]
MPDLTLLVIALLGGIAIAVSKLLRRFVPEIIVFLALGVLIGPDGPVELINDTNINTLELLTELALAAIIFLIGDRLRIDDLRARRGLLVPLNVVQLLATGALVFGVLRMVGIDARVAVLLALIAAETGVLTVTATVKEQRAAGAYTDTVLASVALTNVAVAAMFGLAFPFVLALSGVATTAGDIVGVFAQIVVASTLIGVVGGLLLKNYGPAIESSGELLLFLLIVLTGMTGATIALEGSVVVTSLVAGLYVANAAPWLADRFFAAVRTLEAPIYLIFFVVAGADIHLDELAGVGIAGTAYVLARTLGKVGGAAGGAVVAGGSSQLRLGARTGLSLLPHAGMAIALTAFVSEFAPELGSAVSPVVLGSIVIFELTGPLIMRRMLRRSGDAGAVRVVDDDVVTETDETRNLRRVLIPAGNPEVLVPRLPLLFDLVGNLGAEVVVVHVSLPTGPYEQHDDRQPALLRVFEEIATERGIVCTTVHRRAESVAGVIVQVAREHDCDLIIMGEPTRTRLLEPTRWGLITQRVVRDAPVPVLVYPVDPSRPEQVPDRYLRRAARARDRHGGTGQPAGDDAEWGDDGATRSPSDDTSTPA